jgi:hypothetical protein
LIRFRRLVLTARAKTSWNLRKISAERRLSYPERNRKQSREIRDPALQRYLVHPGTPIQRRSRHGIPCHSPPRRTRFSDSRLASHQVVRYLTFQRKASRPLPERLPFKDTFPGVCHLQSARPRVIIGSRLFFKVGIFGSGAQILLVLISTPALEVNALPFQPYVNLSNSHKAEASETVGPECSESEMAMLIIIITYDTFMMRR